LPPAWVAHCREAAAKVEQPSDFTPTPTGLETFELLRLLTHEKDGAKYRDLLDGNWQSYFKSQSQADQSLMNRLAFYTGGDVERMEEIFSACALGQRPKWQKASYRRATINAAIRAMTGSYSGRPTPIRDGIAVQAPARSAETPRADQVAALQARVAQLEAENAELKDRISLFFAVKRNRKIHTEADTALAVVNEVAGVLSHPRAGEVTNDGYVRASNTRLAEKAAVSAQTVSKHKDRLENWGLIEQKLAWVDAAKHPDTGEVVVPAHTEQFVRLRYSVPDTLRRLATLDPDKPRHGGLRLKACPDHPDAAIRTAWQKHCTVCHRRIDEGVTEGKSAARRRVVTQDAKPAGELSSTVDTRTYASQDAKPPGAGVGVQDERALGADVPPVESTPPGYTSVPNDVGPYDARCGAVARVARAIDGAAWCLYHAWEQALAPATLMAMAGD
jgi:hypothetical protein